MRVVHLSTHDLTGGAARSAWCLHRGLLGIGVESSMLVRSKLSADPAVTGANEAACAILHEQALTPYILRRLPSGSPWFTSGVIDVDISSHPSVQSADVLHLHWVAEWLSAGVIKKLVSLGKPIIWSLHDLWPVTCGNHYPGTNDPRDESWQTGESLPEPLIEIGRSEFQRKRILLADQQIHVVAPSRWIGRMSQRSIIGSKWPVKIVPYGIETRVFCPSDQGEARALGICRPTRCCYCSAAPGLMSSARDFICSRKRCVQQRLTQTRWRSSSSVTAIPIYPAFRSRCIT